MTPEFKSKGHSWREIEANPVVARVHMYVCSFEIWRFGGKSKGSSVEMVGEGQYEDTKKKKKKRDGVGRG